MVSQRDRRRLAEAVRHLADGQITNDQFDENAFFRSEDAAVCEIRLAAWGLYSDNRTYRLRGGDRLPGETRRSVARCILFLHGSLEFEWPREFWWQRGVVLLMLNCLTLGRAGKVFQRQYSNAGNFNMWPFIRKVDYEAALRNPTFLSPSSGASAI